MKLVFVYNADSGVFNTLSDIAHKLLSPGTYECNLCNLTHGYFTAREEWTTFLHDLEAEIEFLHRDEFVKRSPDSQVEFPAIFVHSKDELKLWVDRSVIDSLKTPDALMEMIRAAVLRQRSGVDDDEDLLALPV